MKHKHYDMIVAKAENMDLVVFVKCGKNDKWKETETPVQFPLSEFCDVEYFLCLPQHKEACLHWLNGGEVQFCDYLPFWEDCGSYKHNPEWYSDEWMMCQDNEYRIKPKKEKRWIGVFKDGDLLRNTELSYKTKEQLKGSAYSPNGFYGWQFIEIEVEV